MGEAGIDYGGGEGMGDCGARAHPLRVGVLCLHGRLGVVCGLLE